MSAPAVAAAPSSAASSVSPVSLLYPDTLQCLFQLLPLDAAISAHASCRAWRDAAHREPSRKLSLCRPPADLVWLSRSPLRHHLSTYSSRRSRDTEVRNASHLSLLCQFPCLTDVTLTLTPKAIRLFRSAWPPRLARLDVYLPEHMDKPDDVQALINSVARQPSLTELRMALTDGWRYSLQPLISAPLRVLTLEAGAAAGYAAIKQMQSLERLTFFNSAVDLQMLEALTLPRHPAEPHQLARLASMVLNHTDATAAHLAPLLLLPSLSALHVMSLDPDALSYLRRFPQLRDLQIQSRLRADLVTKNLVECPALTALSLSITQISRDELTILANALTALQSLKLSATAFTGFFEQAGLGCLRPMTQLRVLGFTRCIGLSLACLDSKFSSMPSLRQLSISLPSADVPSARAQLPQVMPQLTSVIVDVNA